MKKYLVKFNCIIGEYEHMTNYIFDKKMTEYGYCKKFWGLKKKNELKTNGKSISIAFADSNKTALRIANGLNWLDEMEEANEIEREGEDKQ